MKTQLRLLWLKLAATIAAMLAGGCMSPHSADEIDTDCIVEPSPAPESDEQSGSSVSFSMDAEQFANLARWLGNGNTLSIEKPVHYEQDGLTLEAKAGTRFSYAMADKSGTFTFEKPFPTIKAGIAKLIGGVSLHEVTIKADGSGLAATGLGKYRFRWMDEAEDAGSSAAEDTKPEMQFQSASWCAVCRSAEKLLDEAEKKGELPFKIKKVEVSAGVSPPRFRWQDNNGDWWHSDGWHGVKPLIEAWKKSLNGRVQRAGGPAASRPFAQGSPDRVSVGSRSVAIWSINGDSTPSRSVLLSHLTNDGIHRGRHDRAMLESLTTEQLRWLHDRDHGQ